MTSYGADFIPQAMLREMGFAFIGEAVNIHPSVILIGTENISIGDRSRIDPHTILIATGGIRIGKHVHIGAGCNLAGGGGIVMDDFSGLSQGVKIYSTSDDYSGESLTNPTVPPAYKKVLQAPVHVGRHAIIGSGAVILPGADIAEGCSVGALSLVRRPTEPWGIYAGTPARRLKERRRDLLALEERLLREQAEG